MQQLQNIQVSNNNLHSWNLTDLVSPTVPDLFCHLLLFSCGHNFVADFHYYWTSITQSFSSHRHLPPCTLYLFTLHVSKNFSYLLTLLILLKKCTTCRNVKLKAQWKHRENNVHCSHSIFVAFCKHQLAKHLVTQAGIMQPILKFRSRQKCKAEPRQRQYLWDRSEPRKREFRRESKMRTRNLCQGMPRAHSAPIGHHWIIIIIVIILIMLIILILLLILQHLLLLQIIIIVFYVLDLELDL